MHLIHFVLSILKDIPPLVEDLNNAGIRFVYFSEENEIKSQVSFVTTILDLHVSL